MSLQFKYNFFFVQKYQLNKDRSFVIFYNHIDEMKVYTFLYAEEPWILKNCHSQFYLRLYIQYFRKL